MKARFLKYLLNNTHYNVHETNDFICVGSPMCPDLINVNKETLKIKYALDFNNEGRKSLEEKNIKSAENELLFIWDTLKELIDRRQIQSIITGQDILENPLPVFACQDGILIETFTDAYGWPNTTIDGRLMYENTWFKTRQEAIAYGIKDMSLHVKYDEKELVSKENEIEKLKARIKVSNERIDKLSSMLLEGLKNHE